MEQTKTREYYKVDIVIVHSNKKTHDKVLVDRFNKQTETLKEAINYIKYSYPNIKSEPMYVDNADNLEPKQVGYIYHKGNIVMDDAVLSREDWVSITKITETTEALTFNESDLLFETQFDSIKTKPGVKRK